MWTKRILIVIIFLISIDCSCANRPIDGRRSSMRSAMGNESLIITEDKIHGLQEQALEGSPEPALQLYLYYEGILLDHKEALYWLQIAAENGHPVGEYNFGYILLEDRSDEQNQQRAKFWLQRAAIKGDASAKELLKDLEKTKQAESSGKSSPPD